VLKFLDESEAYARADHGLALSLTVILASASPMTSGALMDCIRKLKYPEPSRFTPAHWAHASRLWTFARDTKERGPGARPSTRIRAQFTLSYLIRTTTSA
jgi:hypothetical protein